MARPKKFHGGMIGLKLPAEINIRLRVEAKETGKTLSQIVREILEARWKLADEK